MYPQRPPIGQEAGGLLFLKNARAQLRAFFCCGAEDQFATITDWKLRSRAVGTFLLTQAKELP
jgi:hypothetical protein